MYITNIKENYPHDFKMAWNLHTLLGVSLIGVINITYLIHVTKLFAYRNDLKNSCSLSTFFSAFENFIRDNGKSKLTESLPLGCLEKLNKDMDKTLTKLFTKTLLNCQLVKAKNLNSVADDDVTITLFTSWEANSDKFKLHNMTVNNWSSFAPRANLVLFTNDSSLAKSVQDKGWTTYHITHHAAGGSPVLREMFQTVKRDFNSTFYGFANSDILFESSLLDTLSIVYNTFEHEKPIFISGQRTNVNFLVAKEGVSYGNIKRTADQRGELFHYYAEDFFFTNKYFDWSIVPDLVIGRRAYDNWLIFYARLVGAVTLDVSRTLLAVHQTTRGGNYEGHRHDDPDYNDKLLIKLNKPRSYNKGLTICMTYYTFISLCNEIEISKRTSTPKFCSL